MGLICNQDAIAELAAHALGKDDFASSYWQQALSQFRYQNDRFYGVDAAQGYSPSLNVFRDTVNKLLLIPFWFMGKRFSNFTKIFSETKPIIKQREGRLDLGMIRQMITVAFLDEHFPLDQIDTPIVIIGDGWGSLASVIGTYLPGTKIVIVNLTQMLLVDLVYISKALPTETIAIVHTAEEYIEALESDSIRFIAVLAHDSRFLAQYPIGLAININSMQEMDPPVIADYFDNLRNSPGDQTIFYCCNRTEKDLPDGTTLRFDEYPWEDSDRVIVDERCPWHRFFLQARPPFIRKYDGPVQHRLVALSKS